MIITCNALYLFRLICYSTYIQIWLYPQRIICFIFIAYPISVYDCLQELYMVSLCNMQICNTTDVTNGAGTTYHSGASEFIPCFSGVSVAQYQVSLQCFVDRCSIFCNFLFGHFIVCPSFYLRFLITCGFLLPMVSYYLWILITCGNFKLVLVILVLIKIHTYELSCAKQIQPLISTVLFFFKFYTFIIFFQLMATLAKQNL